MAEMVLYDVAARIIESVGSRSLKEIGLWWKVNDELEKLKSTVSQIQAVLLDAEEKYYLVSESSHQLKEWLRQLRDAFYDAEDLVDDFSTHALRKQVMGGTKLTKEVRLFFSRSNQFAYGIEMARKIKAISHKLDAIRSNRQFHLESRTEETYVSSMHRATHSSLPEIFVGREDDKKKIKNLLFSLEYEDNVVVVPIVGIGGLGKTTLVQSVYNDEQVKTHFELKLWVCVSDNFDVQLIVKKILESATGSEVGNLQMNTLKNKLHEKIGGKKYLLVLDDVWNEDSQKWYNLRDLLVAGALGTRILVTTRLEGVATIINSIPSYKLEGLLKNESWNLFKKYAFKRGQEPSSPRQEEIGEEIIEKCNGVPLAIKTLACLLSDKHESEWLLFKNLELSKVQQGATDILPTLKLSYNHLPSYLKHCFAYCCILPKDYQINVTNLIELWMAQGYIIRSNHPTQSLEDIGYNYCMELLSKSLFEVGKRDDDLGRIVKVKMHDLMHDLAILVAGDEISSMENLKEYTRHLSKYYVYRKDLGQILLSLQSANKLRTIILVYHYEQLNDFVSNFPSALRVLSLSYLDIKEVPHSIGKLKHLRYLNLSFNSNIEELPKSITRLHNLQFLNLMGCEKLRQLPKAIHGLVNLRNLDILYCNGLTHMPRGIGKLTSLCHLSKFIVAKPKHSRKQRCGGLGELRGLNNLRGSLEIHNLHLVEKSASSEFWAPNLIEKQHLQSLGLNWGREIDGSNSNDNKDEMFAVMEALRPHPRLKELEITGYGGVKISSWLSSLTNLTSLVITLLDKIQHLPPLQHLFSLGSLSISDAFDLEYIEDSCNINNQGRVSGSSTPIFFPSLKDLILKDCPNLKGWWRTIETEDLPQFHCLSDLEITDCPNLTSIPLLPALKSLELRDVNLQLLHQIFKIPPRPYPQPLFSFPPSSLTHLPSQVEEEEIQNVQQKHLPEESSFRHLTSLKILVIGGRSGLAILSRVMQNLISLEHLTIRNVKGKELSPSDNENEEENDDLQCQWQWQCLRSLKTLSFLSIRNWASLPKGFQQLTTLHSLSIRGCFDLVSLPDWFGELSSLQHLEIDVCPHLIKRCRNNKGEDWPLIAHIPNIQIDFKSIQRDGNYLLQLEQGSLA